MAKRVIPEVAEAFGADPDELAEAPIAETIPETIPAPVAAPVAPAAAAPISMSISDIQAIVATAIAASQQGNQNLAEIVTQGIAQARKPIPEGTDASNPKISVFNPLGDRDYPRPGLKCEFTYGTQDAKTKQISRTYPLEAEDLTVIEQIALNTLEAGHYSIKLHDDTPIKLSIVPDLDPATDVLTRMVLVVPQIVTGKGSALKNMLPGPIDIVRQVTGKDFSTLAGADLAWFMAEHKAKRYVSTREEVAA
jgi:hypothetical protein